jgi:hypothetical protein
MKPLNQHSFSISDWWNGLLDAGESFVGWHYDYVPGTTPGAVRGDGASARAAARSVFSF